MAELVKYREKFLIPAHKSIEIRVTPVEEASGRIELDAWYLCIDCDVAMSWVAGLGWWQCAECGYELTAHEAQLLGRKHIGVVKQLSALTAKKKGMLWRWLAFFRGERHQK